MKKYLVFLLLFALLLPLCGCAGTEESLSIVTTNFAAYDFALEIVGRDNPNATVTFLAGGDVHSFDPTFSDMAKIEAADLFLYVGGESDAAIDTLLASLDGVPTFKLIDHVTLLEESHEDEHDHDEILYDEHVWTSPKNAILLTAALSDAIAAIDPQNAAHYRQNAAIFCEKLTALDERFTELIGKQNKTLIFGDRFPLLYFARDYGLRYEAAFVSCHTTSEPSMTRVSELIALAQSEKIGYIFHIEGGSHSVCDRIAAESGAKTALFHACHKVTASEMAAGATYLSLMEANYLALKAAIE